MKLAVTHFPSVVFLLLLTGCGMQDVPPSLNQVATILYGIEGNWDLLQPESEVSFVVDMLVPEGVETPALQIEKSLNGSEYVLHAPVKEWPIRISLSLTEIMTNWAAAAELRKGDEIRLRAVPIGASDFRVGEPVIRQLICPSDIAGTYLATTVGSAGPGGGGAYDTLRYEISLISLGNGKYEISEISGGMYPLIWNGKPQSGSIQDSCLIIVIPPQTDQWDDKISGIGSILDDGQIYYQWVNTYGDKGQTWLKKQ